MSILFCVSLSLECRRSRFHFRYFLYQELDFQPRTKPRQKETPAHTASARSDGMADRGQWGGQQEKPLL
ncbi:Hypp2037 [Branchiostoma lanceolatum]|uniref:Hypp2037 protein n=1 Tax=Branchiostoma lanceolatum TaxID=7740 RepID=A0A8K0ENM6_BRALA|nr:Hypp2037 [Branchiostoma lanceolatum]